MCLAVPGKLISMTEGPPLERRGKVEFGGVVKDVSLAFLPDAAIGDYVLVHVGVALSKISEEEAKTVFEYLQQIDDLDELKTTS